MSLVEKWKAKEGERTTHGGQIESSEQVSEEVPPAGGGQGERGQRDVIEERGSISQETVGGTGPGLDRASSSRYALRRRHFRNPEYALPEDPISRGPRFFSDQQDNVFVEEEVYVEESAAVRRPPRFPGRGYHRNSRGTW